MSQQAHIEYDTAEKGLVEAKPPLVLPSYSTLQLQRDVKDVKVSPQSSDIKTPVALAPAAPQRRKNYPTKRTSKVSKWIQWKIWYNTYRKFFTFVVTLNLVGLVLAISGHFPYAIANTGAFVLGNFQFGILMRNELFGRFLYLFVNTLFAKWTPLKFRLGCTSVLQHLGGIHSGCCMSGCLWLLLKMVNTMRDRDETTIAVAITGLATLVLVVATACSAFPWVRNAHHNVFERHHRFLGWTGLVATWIFTMLGIAYDPVTGTFANGANVIFRNQQTYFIMAMTAFVVWPWVTVREVEVDIELPSPKVAIVRFKRGMQQGLLGRVSRTPIMEYHAFGIISEGTHAKYHYMICGVQGDFTKSLVNDPPRTLWTRELKFAGVSNTSALYRRGIRVCTGTGIGAALSTCLQSPHWYLIWIGSDQEKTFGPTISGLIHRHLGPDRLCLWDSRKRGGRPEVMKLVKEAYSTWKAEVVFITSNFQGNSEIMEGCKEAGIPAFGTLWDF